jgi:AcrR family transcriptional regulator
MTRSERARQDLLLVAERLFATHGIDSVSLRQIAVEAGYANPATIQYHFGTKAGLYQAIVEYRMPGIEARRAELLDERDVTDPRQLAEVMARPLLEMDRSSYYAEFVGQLVGRIDELPGVYEAAVAVDGGRRIRAAVDALLADVAPAARAMRLKFVTLLMVHAIANRRARGAAGHDDGLTERAFEAELFTAMAAVLCPAPALVEA